MYVADCCQYQGGHTWQLGVVRCTILQTSRVARRVPLYVNGNQILQASLRCGALKGSRALLRLFPVPITRRNQMHWRYLGTVQSMVVAVPGHGGL